MAVAGLQELKFARLGRGQCPEVIYAKGIGVCGAEERRAASGTSTIAESKRATNSNSV